MATPPPPHRFIPQGGPAPSCRYSAAARPPPRVARNRDRARPGAAGSRGATCQTTQRGGPYVQKGKNEKSAEAR